MAALVLRKLAALPLALLGVSVLIFLVIHALPGDPARMMAGPEATEAAVNGMRARMGLDRPLPAQYLAFATAALHGDFGLSLRSQNPVVGEIAQRLPFTLSLAVVSYAAAILLGVPAGMLAAIRQGGWADQAVMLGTILGASVASFWLALLLMSLFAVQLGWLPLLGAAGWRNYVMPATVLAALPAALIARMTRAGMIEVLRLDYIRTAWAKGLPPRAVYFTHALRNVLAPVVTVVGLNFGSLVGGAVVTETVFAWPGMGKLIVDSINVLDRPVIVAYLMMIVLLFVTINLLVDLLYTVLDPRIRLGAAQ